MNEPTQDVIYVGVANWGECFTAYLHVCSFDRSYVEKEMAELVDDYGQSGSDASSLIREVAIDSHSKSILEKCIDSKVHAKLYFNVSLRINMFTDGDYEVDGVKYPGSNELHEDFKILDVLELVDMPTTDAQRLTYYECPFEHTTSSFF